MRRTPPVGSGAATTSPALPRPALRPGLSRREVEALELMDDPGCDHVALERTYAQFRTVNRLVSGWRRVYTRRLRPLLSAERTTTLLDVGFGAGDIPRALARWAASDGLRLEITAIDPDPRAHDFARRTPGPVGLEFRQATSSDLVAAGEQYDLVTSNHVLHHLEDAHFGALLADCERLARRLVVHNDIARHRVAYAGYVAVTWPFGARSFVHYDGALSIRRSYRPAELQAAVAGLRPGRGWSVEAQAPFRVLLTCLPGGEEQPGA